MSIFIINHKTRISVENIYELASGKEEIALDDETVNLITKSRDLLDSFVESGRVIYGVNTSMGGFVNWLVPICSAKQLQQNLLNAVATNVGQYMDERATRSMMLARIVSLSKGYSAISVSNLQVLIALYNKGVVPCVPAKGSLGTSGDLGPLAAIALVCCGKWKAYYNGRYLTGEQALQEAGIPPADLNFKEGLALINGTSGMTGVASQLLADVKELFQKYLIVSALSFEALAAIKKPFDPRVHLFKPHRGQQHVAQVIFSVLEKSKMIIQEADIEKKIAGKNDGSVLDSTLKIEDAYSIRCTPHILGAIYDNIHYNVKVVEDELNSSNDNPLIIPEYNEIFHNGHFHGQYVSMSMDFLAVALTTWSNLSNRRIDRFLDQSHSNGLPPFLCSVDAGLRLGLMGGQFMSASLTAENRSLCSPISIQSLSTTADFQDIVSLGFVASRRACEIYNNLKYVLAFELICACQAAELRGPSNLSPQTHHLFESVRKHVPFFDRDEILTEYIEKVRDHIL